MAQVLLEEGNSCAVCFHAPKALGIPPEREVSVPTLLMVGLFTFTSFLYFLPLIYA